MSDVMSDVDREDVEIRAIAAMTMAEVRAALRPFGLRPFERLPPELSCLRASEESQPRTTTKLIEQPEETQSVVAVTPDRETARRKSRNVPVWAAMRWQFQWLKNAWAATAFLRAPTMPVVMLMVAVGVGVTFGVREIVQRLKQPTVVVYDVPDSAYSKVTFADFTTAEELSIRKAMAPLLTQRCTQAFANAGLRSPLEVAMHEGIVILPSTDLYMYSANRLGLASDQTRLAFLKEFSSYRAQAGTVPFTRYGVEMTTDGRARIFLNETAFEGESLFLGKLSLNDVLAHEFIHVGGQPATPGWFFQHDLAGFEHYDELMGGCR